MTAGEWPGDDAALLDKGRYHTQQMLSLQKFDGAMGIVILINSIFIGWESSCQIENISTKFFEDVEHIFLGIYVFELGARLFAFGWRCILAQGNGRDCCKHVLTFNKVRCTRQYATVPCRS